MNLQDHAKRILEKVEAIWAIDPNEATDPDLIDIHQLAVGILEEMEESV